ncbi:MAG: hypothetical protein ACT4PY_01125 [Armatimonadota bacterium]
MLHKARPLALGSYAFLPGNVVMFHGLTVLSLWVSAPRLAVAASMVLAALFLVQMALGRLTTKEPPYAYAGGPRRVAPSHPESRISGAVAHLVVHFS